MSESPAERQFRLQQGHVNVAAKHLKVEGARMVRDALISLALGAKPEETAGIEAAIDVAAQKVEELSKRGWP